MILLNIMPMTKVDKWCRERNLRYRDNTPDLGELLLSNAPETAGTGIIHNFLHERDIIELYAPQKVGKTHFADALAQAIATGRELTPHFQVLEQRSVIVFNGEMRLDQLQKRRRSVERQVGECVPGGPYCEYVSFGMQEKEECADLSTPEGQRRFLELIDASNEAHRDSPRARVFVLDSLKTLTRGGDGQAKWNSLFRFLNALRTEHPWTFIIIHHTNKKGGDYGTNDKAIKVDLRVHLTRDAETVLKEARDYFPGLKAKNGHGQKAGVHEPLERQLARHFSGDRKDCIWFFFMLSDMRDLPRSAGRPFLMEMCPEDNPPRWEATELDDRGLLIEHGALAPECEASPEISPDSANGLGEQHGSRQSMTYEKLKNADRETVIEALRQIITEAGPSLSRRQLGQRLGAGKDGIDYLMGKHGLKNEDIGLK